MLKQVHHDMVRYSKTFTRASKVLKLRGRNISEMEINLDILSGNSYISKVEL